MSLTSWVFLLNELPEHCNSCVSLCPCLTVHVFSTVSHGTGDFLCILRHLTPHIKASPWEMPGLVRLSPHPLGVHSRHGRPFLENTDLCAQEKLPWFCDEVRLSL